MAASEDKGGDKGKSAGRESEAPLNSRLEENSEITFYYSREHRLARASSAVRELNDGKSAGAGFIRGIAGIKGNIFPLAAILIICVTIIFISRSSRPGGEEFLLGGNTVSFRIESVGGEGLILHINKKAPKNGTGEADVYTGTVDLAVSPVIPGSAQSGEEAPIMNHRIFFTFDDTETYSTVLPFDGENFLIIIQTENERIIRRISRRR